MPATPPLAGPQPDDGLPRLAPHRAGVSADAIGRFLDTVAALGMELHSFMLYRAGHVVAEGWWSPYRASLPHMQHSLTKSFTATGVGLAVAEGLLRLDDRVVSFFPADAPTNPGDHLAAMTVRDLLTMRTGHATGISGGDWRQIGTSWVRAFFDTPVPERPGTRFVYSSASSFMLSAIVQAVSGERLHDYLRPRLLEPLGCGADLAWDVGPGGINPGGNGLTCRTADLVRLGAVHLQGGQWGGRQLVPADWVAAATRPWVAHASADGPPEGEVHLAAGPQPANRGYGFHWWTGPQGAYYAAGLFGQYAVVLPRQDAVVAFTGALPQRDQRLLDLVWRDLMPALGPAAAGGDAALQARLRDLALQLPAFAPVSPLAARVSGTMFAVAPNEDGVRSVSFRFSATECLFTLEDGRGSHTVHAGLDRWIEGDTTVTGGKLHHQYQPARLRVSAGGAWTAADSFTMVWIFIETAFRDEVTVRFADGGMTLDRSVNVNSGPTRRPRLEGRA